ncbi:hypothetical protein [Streptomyces sp. NPDC051561]
MNEAAVVAGHHCTDVHLTAVLLGKVDTLTSDRLHANQERRL